MWQINDENPTSNGRNSFGKSISFSTISVKLSFSLRVLSSNESEPSLPGDKQDGPRCRPRLRISLSTLISVSNKNPLKFSVIAIKSNFGSLNGIWNWVKAPLKLFELALWSSCGGASDLQAQTFFHHSPIHISSDVIRISHFDQSFSW